MRKTSKGTIKMSTHGKIPVLKTGLHNDFTEENVLNDFNEAAKLSNFNATFKISKPFHELPKCTTLGNSIFCIEIEIENFTPISFMMSMPTASQEDQDKFKAWSKFWTSLTKIGYNVK